MNLRLWFLEAELFAAPGPPLAQCFNCGIWVEIET
jgi:hypothetical protein